MDNQEIASAAVPGAVALICDRCGAPMKTRRECRYCGTVYYLGPELPEPNFMTMENYMHYGSSFSMILHSGMTRDDLLPSPGFVAGRVINRRI